MGLGTGLTIFWPRWPKLHRLPLVIGVNFTKRRCAGINYSINGSMIMPLSSNPSSPSRRLVLGALAALPTLPLPFVASAQAQTTNPGRRLAPGPVFHSLRSEIPDR